MSLRPAVWRAIAAFAVVAASLALALTSSAKLGLDLRGGTQIVLETQSTDRVKADAESTNRALEVLRGRVDALGVAEPTLARSGEKRIIIELPGLQDPREAAKVIGRTAQLTFHEVLSIPPLDTKPTKEPAKGEQVVNDEDGNPIVIGKPLL